MNTSDQDGSQHKRLVLCFDGTAKKFAGDQTDSNVVKIYQMLDRTAEDQYHYYQPGIGTYIEGDSSYGFLHDLRAFFSMGLDQALGLSFRHHVIAGYQFIMRYYSPGDYIYIIGFSRGAYTARFLAEMLHKIGLLSRGNEELVSFAWKTFSDYQTTRKASSAEQSLKHAKKEKYMEDFKKTFCRGDNPNTPINEGVGVHFLGLFDCVNSVGQFDLPLASSSFQHIPTQGIATHIRHAVSINERRIKFKPALFKYENNVNDGDVKEVWFAGAHGDIGGGWPRDTERHETRTLSTLALKWMIREIINLPKTADKLKFGTEWAPLENECIDVATLADETEGSRDDLDRFVLVKDNEPPVFPRPHDELEFGRGGGSIGALFWRFIEWIPLFSYLVFHHDKGVWTPRAFPPNRGTLRDIPKGATIHESVKMLHKAGVLEDWEVAKAFHACEHEHAPPASGHEAEPLLGLS